jgi:NitT/TauT family transport system substrate-binding protein
MRPLQSREMKTMKSYREETMRNATQTYPSSRPERGSAESRDLAAGSRIASLRPASGMKGGGVWCALSLVIAATLGAIPAQAQDKISIVVFGSPSLGNFLPPVIKAQKLDDKHGLSLAFEERPPDAYSVQFNSGEFQVGGSASLLTVGLADTRGVKVAYLFNLFDFWGAVVTSRPEIKSVKDLEGKDLAAAKGTTNYVMFEWFARQLGADPGKFSVVNTATPGLVGYALADRATAVQLWEPAYTTLSAKKPDIRTLDLKLAESWQKFTGSRNIPYLGVAAHVSWIEKNKPLIPKLYAAYQEAAAWTSANPDAAAKLISPKATPDDQKAIADLIRHNDRLGLNVRWASDVRKEINSVYAAGRDLGFLGKDPAPSTIYAGESK